MHRSIGEPDRDRVERVAPPVRREVDAGQLQHVAFAFVERCTRVPPGRRDRPRGGTGRPISPVHCDWGHRAADRRAAGRPRRARSAPGCRCHSAVRLAASRPIMPSTTEGAARCVLRRLRTRSKLTAGLLERRPPPETATARRTRSSQIRMPTVSSAAKYARDDQRKRVANTRARTGTAKDSDDQQRRRQVWRREALEPRRVHVAAVEEPVPEAPERPPRRRSWMRWPAPSRSPTGSAGRTGRRSSRRPSTTAGRRR